MNTNDHKEESDTGVYVSGGTLIAYSFIFLIGVTPGMILAAFLTYQEHDIWAGISLVSLPSFSIMLYKFIGKFAFFLLPIIVIAITYGVFEFV